ncbi:cytochrome c oxidase subunit I [Blastopirellula retiformator]|uniref:Alternative cytochrome c oxidase subunit 1 n=1 Tax=Blastopirellula retiformator TaxID=2527970 RepID=A0A5C5VPE6_9BACT|nr:cbb3-type cytochrome c oxidase subunit I [Blastopirellula retiformator]TWT39691.1 Alternative cytochrome c oxidase subunit 1 [Blastopirellula retiformator]
MSTTTIDSHTQAANSEMSIGHFLSTYVFSRDHKVIGIQFLFSTLIWFVVGGLLALGIRWQLAWPWSNMPVIGNMLFSAEGGQISPEFYTVLVTMHATVMIFLVIIPILAGAFGNFLIPLMIGADDMAFPTLNMLSYWFMWPAFICFGAAFFCDGHGAAAGWTSYPPLSAMTTAAPGSGDAQTFWLLGVTFVGVSSMLGSVNYMTTIIQMRAPGMTMFRLPLTIWGMFITALLQAFALPVLTAAGFMLLADRLFGTGFFLPEALSVNNSPMASGGGQPLLWQHLFWFYSHPAVYIMILPAMGMVSDILACFARKPIFGYKPMVYSICGIAGLGFIVWGHHMFVSGMNPGLGMTFMVATMMIALPSAVKTFNWLGTVYGGQVQFTTPMLFALSFVSMFVIGGLSGIFMAATPVDIVIHDTYFIVAHFHYVLFCGTAMAVFGSIYFWFPKMFGRMMNETWGKIHFTLTFIFMNGTFFTMHILGAGGFPRRLADPYHYPTFSHMLTMNQFMTVCAIGMVAVQVIFAINFFYSLFWGPKAGRNPWHANGLEWQAPSPPGHGNFDFQPIVYRGPYEYGSPETDEDYYPQTMPPKNERPEPA